MPTSLPRRALLSRAALCGAAAAFSPWGGALAPWARAIEPIQRPGPPKFKFSLAAYSYRDLLSGKPPKLSMSDFVNECAAMQLEGAELTSYYFPADVTDDALRRLREQCFRLGLEVSGGAVGNDFCHPAGDERKKQIASVKQWIDRYALLTAPVIRIFSGGVKPGQNEAESRRLAIEGIEECCEYAGSRGLYLALENHGGLTEKPEGMLEIIRAVKSPWFGVNVDTGNFHGSDVYADLEKIAPYALNVQIKVTITPAGGKKTPSDLPRLAKILSAVGYRGYIVLEYEENEDPRVACPRHLDELRRAFG